MTTNNNVWEMEWNGDTRGALIFLDPEPLAQYFMDYDRVKGRDFRNLIYTLFAITKSATNSFIRLADTPEEYTPGAMLKVNLTGDALEWYSPSDSTYLGEFTPNAFLEYPNHDGGDEEFYVITGLGSGGYTFTTGDLNGVTVYNNYALTLFENGSYGYIGNYHNISELWINGTQPDSLVDVYNQASGGDAYRDCLASGVHTEAKGSGGATAFGRYTKSSGRASFAACNDSEALGDGSFAVNSSTKALGNDSSAFGGLTIASGDKSFSVGTHTESAGTGSLAGGTGNVDYKALALGYASFAFYHQESTTEQFGALADYSVVLGGINNKAEGDYSIVLGGGLNTASGVYSIAEGNDTVASGDVSHSEGYNTVASGSVSHAEGGGTVASGNRSHAEGKTQ